MLPDAATSALLALLGGWVAIDGTTCGQFMVSRPFVAAALAGWIVGDPAAGALLGVALEAFHLTVLPVGAARYPEGGPAAVVAGALYAATPGPGALLTSLVFFLVWGWVGAETVHHLRQYNVQSAAVGVRPITRAEDLERRHLAAIALDFARGAVLVLAGAAVLSLLLHFSRSAWGLDERASQLAAAAAVAGLLASCLRLFGGRMWLFFAGAVTGGVFLLVRS